MRTVLRTLAGLALLAAAAPPAFALPTGTLEYMQRLGVATPAEPIEVLLRFTLDPNGQALRFSSNPLLGFDPAELPTTGVRFDPVAGQFVDVPFAPGSIERATLETWFGCTGNTFNQPGCAPGPYLAQFAGSPSGDTAADLDPGEVVEYRMLSFLPQGGAAPPGTYRLPTSGLQIRFSGRDLNGDPLDGYHGLASVCGSATDDCAFTREVRAVPEPALPALLLAGCAALRLTRRRG